MVNVLSPSFKGHVNMPSGPNQMPLASPSSLGSLDFEDTAALTEQPVFNINRFGHMGRAPWTSLASPGLQAVSLGQKMH